MSNETEEQQIEELKKWWKDNGSSIITGVVLGLAALFGGKAWFAYQDRIAENASNHYAIMMAGLERNDARLVADKAGVLIGDFSSTPYASLAAFALAKLKTEADELDAAQAQLQWVIDHTSSDMFRDAARVRLARVLIAKGDLDAAEAVLAQPSSGKEFELLFSEARGDIHVARGDTAAAEVAYQQVLAETGTSAPGRHLLQLKYDQERLMVAASEGQSQ